jgi:hypothetical protein
MAPPVSQAISGERGRRHGRYRQWQGRVAPDRREHRRAGARRAGRHAPLCQGAPRADARARRHLPAVPVAVVTARRTMVRGRADADGGCRRALGVAAAALRRGALLGGDRTAGLQRGLGDHDAAFRRADVVVSLPGDGATVPQAVPAERRAAVPQSAVLRPRLSVAAGRAGRAHAGAHRQAVPAPGGGNGAFRRRTCRRSPSGCAGRPIAAWRRRHGRRRRSSRRSSPPLSRVCAGG